MFKRQVAAAGIEDANFHAMRHTFATRSLEAGMDIMVLSRILGHAQPSTTLNKYGHALPDHKRSSMADLGAYPNRKREADERYCPTGKEETRHIARRGTLRENDFIPAGELETGAKSRSFLHLFLPAGIKMITV